MSQPPLEYILEAALLAAERPLSVERLRELFDLAEQPSLDDLRKALTRLAASYAERAIELKEVASGWRLQVRQAYAPWVARLWEERPQRYSRALLETLALVVYRQPITRGEIEDIRGVAVSTHIIKTLLEREWVRVVGHREVPGRPAMYATTRQFLDYFNLQSLADLPPLAAISELSDSAPELALHDEGWEAEGQPDTPWLPVEPLAPLNTDSADADFHGLLAELKVLESNLKSDFEDLPAAVPEQAESELPHED